MYKGVPSSEEIKKLESEGIHVTDDKHIRAAAKALREPILLGQIELFAVLSSRDLPMRLHNRALINAALFPSTSIVLTFAYIDRQFQAPFGHSWSDLKELTRDPLCVKQRAFRIWMKKQERKKAWPCHQANDSVPRSRGRPSDLMANVIGIIEDLHSKGKFTPAVPNKEVQALVQKAFLPGRGPSPETVRLARKEVESKNR
jgi:hypothetical protein